MRLLLGAALALGIVAQAQAHFVFLKPGKDGRAEAVFSDSLDPDREELIAKIKHGEFRAGGKALKSEQDGGVLRVASAGDKPAWVVGTVPYGVVEKGKVAFKLTYRARTVVNGTPADAVAEPEKSGLDVVPVLKDGKVVAVRVLLDGKPLAKGEVLHLPPRNKGEWIKKKTDERGETAILGDIEGLHAVRAGHVARAKGESSGKKYQEERAYATLTFAAK